MALPNQEDLRQTGLAALATERPELALDDDDIPAMDVDGAAALGDRVIGITAQLQRGSFLDSAEGEALTSRAADRGVTRRTASPAIGTLTFGRTTTTDEDTLAAGSTITSTDGTVSCTLDADATMAIGINTVDVTGTVTVNGPSGNVLADGFTVILDPPADDWTVTNADRFAGGNDEESDVDLRDRVRLKRLADREATFTALEYHARAVVGCAKATALEDELGTVTVYVADQDGGSNDDLVDRVTTALIGHAAAGADWYVEGGALVDQAVQIRLTARPGVDTSLLASKAVDAVRARAAKLRHGDILYRELIQQAALNVDTVNLLRCEVVVPATDVEPAANEIVYVTSVTVL